MAVKGFVGWAAALLLVAPSAAVDLKGTCAVDVCTAGTKVVSYATKADPFYACPTSDLAEYMAYVVGLTSAVIQLTGQLPAISPATGDPIQTGMSKVLLDKYRSAAGVRSFDEAAGRCQPGRARVKLILIDAVRPDRLSAWVVEDGKPDRTYWMPRANLDRRQ